MITDLDEFTAASVIQLINSIEGGCGQSLKTLIPAMSSQEVCQNETLFQAGQENRYEYLLLKGLLGSFILDVEDNEFTVAFHSAPCVITPFLARETKPSTSFNCCSLDIGPIRAPSTDPSDGVMSAARLDNPLTVCANRSRCTIGDAVAGYLLFSAERGGTRNMRLLKLEEDSKGRH